MLTLTKFDYTRWVDCYGSSFVSEAHYNQNTQELLVELYDEHNDLYSWYRYHDVPLWRVEEFDNASSKGTYYNQQIKPHYGPGDQLSDEPDTVYVSVTSPRVNRVPVNPTQVDTAPDVEPPAKSPLRVYTLDWTWNGQDMPAHVVEAVDEEDAIHSLAQAIRHLGLSGAFIRYLHRDVLQDVV